MLFNVFTFKSMFCSTTFTIVLGGTNFITNLLKIIFGMNDDSLKDILIAEDDRDDVEIFELALKEINLSYELRHAENGDKLFILLKEKMPYILFLDINMPCKDGISCIMEIRKSRDYDAIPIVVYTSSVYQKSIDECYRNGANLYLSKTYTLASLKEKLQRVFSIDWENYLHYPPLSQFIIS